MGMGMGLGVEKMHVEVEAGCSGKRWRSCIYVMYVVECLKYTCARIRW